MGFVDIISNFCVGLFYFIYKHNKQYITYNNMNNLKIKDNNI